MKRFFFILFLPFVFLLSAFMPQGKDYIEQNANQFQQQGDSVYSSIVVDSVPVFPGGDHAFTNYILSNIVYPSKAKADNIFGTVYVSYVIWSDGSVGRVKVLRGVHELLDREAIRLIKSMPDWKPAEINNIPVACEMIVPIRFHIR